MVLGHVNRTAWGTKLLLTAIWASLVDFTSSRHLLPEGTALLFESQWVLYPAFGPPPTPLPIESIRDITGAEKKPSNNQQHPSSLLK